MLSCSIKKSRKGAYARILKLEEWKYVKAFGFYLEPAAERHDFMYVNEQCIGMYVNNKAKVF